MEEETEMSLENRNLSPAEIDRIVMMAWEDRTSFDAIQTQFDLTPGEVIKLMRSQLKPASFRLWRKRTSGRVTKHERLFEQTDAGDQQRRFRAKSQRG
ncbi:MAG: TIGR03643 family protein [Planctomycetota bacterium]